MVADSPGMERLPEQAQPGSVCAVYESVIMEDMLIIYCDTELQAHQGSNAGKRRNPDIVQKRHMDTYHNFRRVLA